MDTRLIGKTVYIGREAATSRLRLMMNVDGSMKDTSVDTAGKVPDTVSRCLGESKAHCSVEFCAGNKVKVRNMNDHNVTFINDHAIDVKMVDVNPQLSIKLGPDGYKIGMDALISAASALLPQLYDIRPLEKVWNDYEKQLRDLRLKRERFVAVSSITGILSTCGMICMFIEPLKDLRILFLVITLVLSIYFIKARLSAPKKNMEDEQKIKDQFMDNYVCPNPNCNHFLGMSPYRVLRQNKNCPYCKAKLEETSAE